MESKPKQEVLVVRVAELAMKLGGRHLADYGATTSRKDFTQRQLMTCLILRAYLKTTYRGVLELLEISPRLREAMGLSDKLPHYTTLQKFSARSQVLEIVDVLIQKIGLAAWRTQPEKSVAAMDATGMETTTASAHFQSRRGGLRRKWVKISTIVLCGSLLPLSLVMAMGPNNDKCQARELISKARQSGMPEKVYADAGYDAEWVHVQCREEWGVETIRVPLDNVPGLEEKLVEAAKAAVGHVAGHRFEDAIVRFAFVTEPTRPDELKRRIEDPNSEGVFTRLFGATTVRPGGQTSDTKPPLASDDQEERAIAVLKEMYSQARTIDWPVKVRVFIESARQQIVNEHPARPIDLSFLVQDNPFIPLGRENLFLRGLLRRFCPRLRHRP